MAFATASAPSGQPSQLSTQDHALLAQATHLGLLTPAQIERVLYEHQRWVARGKIHPLSALLPAMRILTQRQVQALERKLHLIELQAGTFAGFRVIRSLGSGGMGEVHVAEDDHGHRAALKVMHPGEATDQNAVRRFARELRVLRHLHHVHIVAYIASGHVARIPYIVMELAPGPTLSQRIREHNLLDGRESVILMAQIASALLTAWGQGVVHRDLKPANVILAPPRDGIDEPFCAKILDFGLAKAWQISRASLVNLTGPAIAIGSPHYISPEQAMGSNHSIDQRSDIYALAATMVHAITGETLFAAIDSHEIMQLHLTAKPPLAGLEAAGLPRGLVELITRMLAKSRADRPPSWHHVLADLHRIDPALTAQALHDAGTTFPALIHPSPATRIRAWWRRWLPGR